MMVDTKLLKEFPFLEGLETRFGDLGVIRVRSIPRSEIGKVKDLPATQQYKEYLVNQVLEISPAQSGKNNSEGAGFLVHYYRVFPGYRKSPVPEMIQTTIFKIKEDTLMENLNIRAARRGEILMDTGFGGLLLGEFLFGYNSNEAQAFKANPMSQKLEVNGHVVEFEVKLLNFLEVSAEYDVLATVEITSNDGLFAKVGIAWSNSRATAEFMYFPESELKRCLTSKYPATVKVSDGDMSTKLRVSFMTMLLMAIDCGQLNVRQMPTEGFSYLVTRNTKDEGSFFNITFIEQGAPCEAEMDSNCNIQILEGSAEMFRKCAEGYTLAW